jgi:GPN-loop GTPase
MQTHAKDLNRNLFIVNLDPAADAFSYECAIDIRELITLEDAMEEMSLGPNGGLIFCIE